MRTPVLILPVKIQILQTWGKGGWGKNGKILRTSFMDGPLCGAIFRNYAVNL